jgi:hypothetical protein
MLLALQAPFNFINKTRGIKMCHTNELNETNLMKPKQNLKQVELEQHEKSSNVDLPLGIKNQMKLNQKIEEFMKCETFKYVSSRW